MPLAILLAAVVAAFYAGKAQGALSERVRVGRLLATLSKQEAEK